MALITCKNLALGYDGKPIISNLNLSVSQGDYLCIVGENGSGKSTLVKTLLNLQKPIHGTMKRGDGLKPYEIGYLPQQSAIQRDFPATVGEIVLSGCLGKSRLWPSYRSEEKALAEKNIKKLGLEKLKKRCYRELSGGQQQRVLLARALCAADKLLLLDEPVSGLDPKVTQDMYNLIKKLNQEDGMAIIMVSHDIDAAINYASHILHIGETVFFGTVEEYRNSEIGKFFLSRGGVLV